MKVSRKKAPKMVESTLKIKKDPYADGGEIERKEELNTAAQQEQLDEHSETGMEKDDTRIHPEEDDFFGDQNDSMLMAEGGAVKEEAALEDAASAVAAIMAKRRMARGGEILSEDALMSDDSDQADLSRNADEDQNLEDQASFDALMKENYSESEGLDELDYDTSRSVGRDIDSDDHDMVSSIRKKMKKSPISR